MRIFKTPPFPQGEKNTKKSFCVTIDSSNRWIAVGNSDSTIHIYDEGSFQGNSETNEKEDVPQFDDFKPVLIISCGEPLCEFYCVSFIPTDSKHSLQLIAGDSIGRIHIFEISIKDSESIQNPELLDKSSILLDLTAKQTPEISTLLCSIANNEINSSNINEDNSIMDISWSADNKLIAFTCLSGKVFLFDSSTKKLIHVIHFPQDTNHNSKTPIALKTLSFDPTNNYLAVMSNEKQVYIYQYFYDSSLRVFYKKLLHTISKNSQKSLLLTRFNRFNWCPSGSLLAVPNSAIEPSFTSLSTGTNNSSASISTISNATANAAAASAHVPINLPSESGNVTHSYSISTVSSIAMTSPISNFKNVYFSLIGHDFSSIETAKFAPYMMSTTVAESCSAGTISNENDKRIDKKYNYMIATTGIDRSLAIWSTKFERPTFAAVNFSKSSILDLCWMNANYSSSSPSRKFGLFLISENGSLAYLKFNSEIEFSGSQSTSMDTATNKIKKISMSVSGLKELESARLEVVKQSGLKPLDATVKILEDKTKKEKSAVDEPKKEVLRSTSKKIEDSSNKSDVFTKDTNSDKNKAVSVSSISNTITLVKKGTKTKKRVAPTQVLSTSSASTQSSNKKPQHSSISAKSKSATTVNAYEKPCSIVSKDVAKKYSELASINNDENSYELQKSKKQKVAEPSVEFLHTQTIINASLAFAKLRLAFPKAAKNIILEFSTDASSSRSNNNSKMISSMNFSTSLQLRIVNGSGNEQKPTRVSLIMADSYKDLNDNSTSSATSTSVSNTIDSSKNSHSPIGSMSNSKNRLNGSADEDTTLESREVFVDFIPKLINVATTSGIMNDSQNKNSIGQFWAVAAMDGTIIVYSASGKRLFPTMVLGVPISFLECKDKYLMAVTCIGEMYVWDVCSRKIHFRPVQLYSLLEPGSKYSEELLTKGDNLTMCSITVSGVPIVTLSNGNGYMYDKDMETWCIVSNSWWVFGSHYWDSTNSFENQSKLTKSDIATSNDRNDNSGIISLIESKTNEEILRRRKTNFIRNASKMILAKHGYENLEISISLAHLENKIMIADKLEDNREFKRLLIIYCKRICELAYKNRLVDVFSDLLGPSGEDEADNSDIKWNPIICGYNKRQLLKEIILACASYREVQRILVMYGKEIGLVASNIIA